MTIANELTRRVAFYVAGTDADGEATAPALVVTRDARIQGLKGGEAVQQQRMQGQQPVIITVRRDSLTKTIDNGFEARDARAAADSPPVEIVWDVQSAIVTEDLEWVEVLAVQRKGQPT